MVDVNRVIWKKFHIKKHDNLPLTGFAQVDRTTIAELFAELGYTKGAEIGVRQGMNAEVLLRINPNLHLTLVDPWLPFHRVTQGRQDRYFRYCMTRLQPYLDRIEVKRMTSMEAAKEVQDNSLDFVYIDGMHEFDFVIMDIITWTPKVRTGGIIAGHDYFHFYQQGVIRAVDAYTLAHNITMWYITNDQAPSYLWVKQWM